MECLTLVGDLGGLFESTCLDVAVERGEEILDGHRLRGGGRLRFRRHHETRGVGLGSAGRGKRVPEQHPARAARK